ncbi:MAG: zinc-ribbon domain-containing protein [Actinomycetota bacterium]|nr:zinc-ribbon domain-containing protein [Actinomycetota bacterium]
MIVCPNCRTSNEEHAQFCMTCGRPLDPGPSLRLRREEGPHAPTEIRPPKPPARWPAFLVLGVLLVGAAGFFGWRVFGPDPCRGKFSSSQFGYCLTIPAGWQADQARVGSASLDQFAPPASSAVVLVAAVDLPTNSGLSLFGSSVRQQDQQAGLQPGEPQATTVGGIPAQQWDISVASQSGGQTFKIREVVVVNGEVGWKISMNDSASAFQSHLASLTEMLRSWRFA